jgi:Rad3-related DNA helicase
MSELNNDDFVIENVEEEVDEKQLLTEYDELLSDVSQEELVNALKLALKVSPLITPSKQLINSCYAMLKALLIDKKKYVIIEAPTGSGKSIFSFVCYYTINYLINIKLEKIGDCYNQDEPKEKVGYLLTSAKALQEQIDKDLDRFNFRENITILKGVANYPCNYAMDNRFPQEIDSNVFISYADRPCKGLDKKQITSKFGNCIEFCSYRCARKEASIKSDTVLNYAYFLNVMRGFSPFFFTRFITIADEAHLIPDIVCNIFNFEFTQYLLNKIFKLNNELMINFKYDKLTDEINKYLSELFPIFADRLISVEVFKEYFSKIEIISQNLSEIKQNPEYINYTKQLSKIREDIDELLIKKSIFGELLKRPEDIYFESEIVSENKINDTKIYKHIVKDLSESVMVKNNFLSKLNKGIFMSATFGNIAEYASMMGIEEDEYQSFRLPSTFDFSQSPIFLCDSGYLNFANFNSNIDKIVSDTIYICNTYHPNEKGIIHTSTFKIAELLQNKINSGLADSSRFLFCKSADDKEKFIELMKTSQKPYVLIGPSLYEGIDLKDDQGRFNILMKVPYAAMTEYIKRKMIRMPFWYKRNTLEKIEQAIGRTNRNVNDYSKVYLMDSLFNKMIYELKDSILTRIRKIKI